MVASLAGSADGGCYTSAAWDTYCCQLHKPIWTDLQINAASGRKHSNQYGKKDRKLQKLGKPRLVTTQKQTLPGVHQQHLLSITVQKDIVTLYLILLTAWKQLNLETNEAQYVSNTFMVHHGLNINHQLSCIHSVTDSSLVNYRPYCGDAWQYKPACLSIMWCGSHDDSSITKEVEE